MKRPDWLKLSPPVVFGLVAAGVLGLGGVVVYLPQLQTASLKRGVDDYRAASPKPDPEKLATLEKGRIDSENAIRTGLIQGIGGTVRLIGLYFTYQNLKATQRNVEIAEDKQVTERFSKAVDMLSSSSLHTRLGGIYALERIARDSDDDYLQVMEVLTAFVREEAPCPPKQVTGAGTAEVKAADPVEETKPEEPLPVVLSVVATGETSQGAEPEMDEVQEWLHARNELTIALPPLRTDIQAVMTVIGRRKPRTEEGKTQQLDLSKTDLRQLQAEKAYLEGVDLFGSHLEGSSLTEAHLEGSSLTEVHLERADLSGTYLERADLFRTHLEGARLSGAHLEGARLLGTHLEGALLSGAHLEDVFLLAVHLEGATLSGAHLERAYILGEDLSQVLGLTQAQLDSVRTDKDTKLPHYLLATQSQNQAPIASPSQTTPESNAEPQPPAT